jgi:hypothetical protein
MRSDRRELEAGAAEPPAAGGRGGIPVRLVLGLLVLAAGAIALANNLGWLEGEVVFGDLIPAGFAAIGLALLTQPTGRGASRWWGLVWVVAGLWIFAHRRGWIDLEFWDLVFPGVLLVFGVLLIRGVFARGRDRQTGSHDPARHTTSVAVMAGNELRSVSQEFRGADLVAFMGAVVLDLRQAQLQGEEAVVDVFTMWGGIEIRVPKEWVVESSVVPFMGAYEDKTEPVSTPGSSRLVVRGVVVMGGVEIKN